jgi:hypothetical protein
MSGCARRDDVDEAEVAEAWRKPACEYGMAGWCGQLSKHSRCYFSTPEGVAAVLGGTYGMTDGHQWVCACPCHEAQNYPPCPHPNHGGEHQRWMAVVGRPVQLGLF